MKLVSQVRKKVQKKLSIEDIADMLEEEASVIKPIYDLLQSHADWEDERICSELENFMMNIDKEGTKKG